MSLTQQQTSGLPRHVKSNILKVSLFATGLSGVVAEYVLSTLATYFLGDSVVQWTMIVSVMLFSMGLGSRLSKYLEGNLLEKFIMVEFTLSVFSAFSALITYTAAAYTMYVGLIIYSLSIIIGIMIGLEIPLVIRVNDTFEQLKINVSSVMEKDYYGSLLGGVFFAFVGLPYLGLTYTPFILGMINFMVATILYVIVLRELPVGTHKKLTLSASTIGLVLLAGIFLAQPIVLFGEQKRYKDQVVYERQTKYQKIVITQWQDDYWLYINGNQQAQYAGRSDVPRAAGASGHEAQRASAACTRAGWGRWLRRTGNPQVPFCRTYHVGRPGPGDDRARQNPSGTYPTKPVCLTRQQG